MKRNLFNEINEFLQSLGSSKDTTNESASSDVNLSDINDEAYIEDAFLAVAYNTQMIK